MVNINLTEGSNKFVFVVEFAAHLFYIIKFTSSLNFLKIQKYNYNLGTNNKYTSFVEKIIMFSYLV